MAGIGRADAGLPPLPVIAAAIGGYDWDGLAPRVRQRQRHAVITANPELLERELTKFEAIAVAFAEALVRRGSMPGPRVAADAGIAVFRMACGRWLAAGMMRI